MYLIKKLNRQRVICLIIVVLQVFCFKFNLTAQYFVEESTIIEKSSNSYPLTIHPQILEVHNDQLYLLGRTNDSNFSTTDNSTFTGQWGLLFLKYDNFSTNVIEAKLSEAFSAQEMFFVNGFLYVFGTADTQLPSYTGMPSSGLKDIYILKLDLDGNLVEATYFGGSDMDQFGNAVIHGDTISLVMSTNSNDVPVTDNSVYNDRDLVYAQFDLATLNLIKATYIGGSSSEYPSGIQILGNAAYIGYSTYSPDIPGVGSDTLNGGSDMAITKIDLATANILSSTYLGGNDTEYLYKFIAQDGQLFIYGVSYSSDFPMAPTSVFYNWTVFARLDTNLNQLAGAYLSSLDETNTIFFEEHGGYFYTVEYPDEDIAEIIKFDQNGIIQWRYAPNNRNIITDFRIFGDKIITINDGYNYNVTGNCTYSGRNYLGILSLDGVVKYANYYPNRAAYNRSAFVDSSRHFLVGTLDSNCFPTTDSTSGRVVFIHN